MIAPLWRLGIDLLHGSDYARFGFIAVADALAVGSLVAMYRGPLFSIRLYRRLIDSPAPRAFLIAGLALFAIKRWYVPDVLAISVLNFAIAMVIDRYVRHPGTIVGSILNFPVLVWIGLISYSIYLWQQPFTYSSLPMAWKLSGAIAFAVASYFLIERPLRNLAHYRRPIAAINLGKV